MNLVRPRLLEWQWSDYALKHRNRTNLALHIVAVPLFDVATLVLVAAAVGRRPGAAALAVVAMVAAVAMQGRGHRKERSAPMPFAGPVDFVSRFVVEQWVTFPRFVLSGGWFRHISHAR
jgi:phage terminase small subunit